MDSSDSHKQLTKSNVYLQIGGIFSLAFSVFQICGIFLPSSIIAFFDGPVKLQAEDPVAFALFCLLLGAVIAAAGLYALSGAGEFRRLPFLRTILVFVTAVFILRGLMFIPALKIFSMFPMFYVFRFLLFCMIAFVVGIIHLIGVIRLFKYGRPERTAAG
jgi:hypothetical protein